MSADVEAKLSLRHSKTAPWSLFLAIERNPELHRRTLEAIHNEVVRTLYDRFPRALQVPDDQGWLLDKLSETFVALARSLVEGKPPCEVEPRDSLVVVLAAIAYLWCPFTQWNGEAFPPRPTIEVNVPPDFDVQALRDTMELWLCNYFGRGQALREALAGVLAEVCSKAAHPRFADAIQEAMLAADLVYGGATPGLVRHTVETGEVGVEAEVLFGVGKGTAEKQALVANMRRVHADLTARHNEGPILDDYANWVEELASDGGLIRGLEGHWIKILGELLYVLPPDTSTALVFGKGSDVHRDAVTVLRRSLEKYTKRHQREGQKLTSIDRPIAAEDDEVSMHDMLPDQRADIKLSAIADVEDLLALITESPEEQQVALLSYQGYTQQSIADQLGRSQAWASGTINELRKRARQMD